MTAARAPTRGRAFRLVRAARLSVAACAFLVAATRARAAHAAERSDAAESDAAGVSRAIDDLFAESLVERFDVDGARLVVSEARGAASVTVCVAAPRRDDAEDIRDAELVERRGGSIDAESGAYDHTWCATFPSTELPLGIWLAEGRVQAARRDAANASGEPGRSAVTGERRSAALALEGTTLVGAAPHAVVGVSGGVTASDVVALVERYFGKTPASAGVERTRLAVRQSTERLSIVEGPVPSPRARYGWILEGGDSARHAALAVAADVLAAGTSSRLHRDLVVRRLLAHTVSVWSSALPGGDLVGVEVEISTRTSLDRARRFVDGAMKQLRLVGPTHGELERARRRLETKALLDWESPAERCRTLARYELSRGDGRVWLEEVRALGALTEEAVRRAAHDAFVDSRRTTVEMYPPRWPEDDPKLAEYRLYTVEPGDSLSDIARRFGVTIQNLARANDLDPKYGLVPGQALFVPPPK